MKKLISILLLSLYLVSTTELYQFLKIPVLIEHYMEHKELNPVITFNTFLKMHYHNPVKDSDYQRDQQLPFASYSGHLIVVFTITPYFSFQFLEKKTNKIQSETILYKSRFYSKEIQNSIWQPPKFC